MDKTQKSLLDTYFRKRGIIAQQDASYSHLGYELNYMLENNFNLYSLNFSEITDLLIMSPKYIDKVDLNKLHGWNIKEILKLQPQLVNNLDLSKLDKYQIQYVLEKQPDLAKFFNLNLLGAMQLFDMVANQPKVIKYLNSEQIDLINRYNIRYLIDKHPELKPYFDKFKNK